jgi:predicted ATPase
VRERLARLDAAVRRAVELVAVAGSLPATLADTLDFDVLERAADLVHATESGHYAISAPLIGDAIAGLLPDRDRTALHARIGEALEAAGGAESAEAIADHYAAAIDVVGAARASAWSATAGRTAAARRAYADARRCFARAIGASRHALVRVHERRQAATGVTTS